MRGARGRGSKLGAARIRTNDAKGLEGGFRTGSVGNLVARDRSYGRIAVLDLHGLEWSLALG
jgi:hypothetical protein